MLVLPLHRRCRNCGVVRQRGHWRRQVGARVVAMAMLAKSEIVAQVWPGASMDVGRDGRVIRGHYVIDDLLRGGGRRFAAACGSLCDRREHQGEHQQDSREAADSTPVCPKSRHRRVYTPLMAYEQPITSRRRLQAPAKAALRRPSEASWKARPQWARFAERRDISLACIL